MAKQKLTKRNTVDPERLDHVLHLSSDISQLTFKSMAIVSTLHRHGNSIPFAALR